MGGLFQPMHLLVILVIVLVIFGPGKIANLGKDLGKSIHDFKKAMSETDVTPAAATPAQTVEPQAAPQQQAQAVNPAPVQQAAQPAAAAQPVQTAQTPPHGDFTKS